MPAIGHAHPWTDMIANPLHTLAAARAGEDVEADFRPAIDALGDLRGLMEGVIGWIHPVFRVHRSRERPGSVYGEIAVQLEHGCLRRDGVRTVNLDFVIILASRQLHSGEEQQG